MLNAKVVTNAIYEILKHFTLLALLHQHRHGDFFHHTYHNLKCIVDRKFQRICSSIISTLHEFYIALAGH